MCVLHNQTEAMTLGDQIVIMKGRWIQQIGTPRSRKRTAANLSCLWAA